jgi:galactose oxidase
MPRDRLGNPIRAGALLGAIAVVASVGCSDERGAAGPRVDEPVPADVDAGLAPVDLSYVCGNRFLVSNSHEVPISVTYRVGGTGEEGTVKVPAAPSIDPAISEELIETRTKGTVQIFLDGKALVARANGGTPCTPVTAAPTFAVMAAAEGGHWTAPFTWPIVAIHMMLLPNGRVLSIGRTGTPRVWNPATGTFTSVPTPANLFCAGHALLADGRVLVAGGHISDKHGLPNITLFSSTTNTWTSSTPMARGRWYPTTTVMGNGDVAILAGTDEAAAVVTIPEVWSNGSLRRLTGAAKSLAWYPRAWLAPNGSLYEAGPDQKTFFLSLAGTGKWTAGPTRLFGGRNYGSAVMYDDGKILYAGGGLTTNTAEVLDLNQVGSPWKWTSPMAFARRHHNLTVLPTGEVLATGGVAGTTFNDISTGVHAAEIWNPQTGHWTTLASNAITRGYHGTSLLLPDGRVLNAGSGEGAGGPNERNAELYSPPYLFKGARPTITSAPTSVGYGASFRILTPDAAAITHVSFIRLAAVTHAFDENQRFQRLSFTADATGLTVTAPSSSNRAPPGHYMVFILNGNDVPSVAKIVQIR